VYIDKISLERYRLFRENHVRHFKYLRNAILLYRAGNTNNIGPWACRLGKVERGSDKSSVFHLE